MSSSESKTPKSPLVARVLNGTLWQGGALLFANASSFLAKLILARLLVPEYFGLVAMAVVFTGLIQTLEDLGINSALVQREESDLTDTDLYTGARAYLIVGIASYFLIILPGAPLVSWFYGEPQLIPIILALGIPILFKPFCLNQAVTLNRALKFKELARIQMVATFIAAILAVGLAFAGAGVWAIVAQWIASSAIKVGLLVALYDGPPKAEFCWDSLKRILSYGLSVTGQRAFTMISNQGDYLILGKMLGASALGAYSLAFLITDSIRGKLMSVMGTVLFPAYSKLQNDLVKLNEYYIASVRFNTLVVIPVICASMVYPEQIILYGFGEEWLEAVAPLRLLALAALIHTIAGTNSQALKAVNRPDIGFKIKGVVSVGFFLPTLIIATYFYGLIGAAWAVIGAKTLERIAFHVALRRVIGTREWDILKALIPSVIAGSSMTIVLYILQWQWPIESLWQLLFFLILGGLVYLAAALPLVWRELMSLRSKS